VDFPPCTQGACGDPGITGGAVARCLIANGYPCCVLGVGDSVRTETGAKSGPFLQALQTRYNNDTDQRQNICYSDYHGNGQRVVNVPMVTAFGSGKSWVTITDFAAFFIRDFPGSGANSTLDGEFLYRAILGTGGPPKSGPGLYTPVLVQ
jgi:hypothetical protein